jgi:hypothetical protein
MPDAMGSSEEGHCEAAEKGDGGKSFQRRYVLNKTISVEIIRGRSGQTVAVVKT